MGGSCLGREGLLLLELSCALACWKPFLACIDMPFAGREVPHDFVDDTPFVGCRRILLQTCMALYVLYKTLSRRIIGRVFKERSGGLELPSKLRRTDSLGLALLVP